MEQDKNAIPTQRNLDGIFFRVMRDGKPYNRCFTDLSVEEREEVLRPYSREQLYTMVVFLADTIRTIGDELNIVSKIE